MATMEIASKFLILCWAHKIVKNQVKTDFGWFFFQNSFDFASFR